MRNYAEALNNAPATNDYVLRTTSCPANATRFVEFNWHIYSEIQPESVSTHQYQIHQLRDNSQRSFLRWKQPMTDAFVED